MPNEEVTPQVEAAPSSPLIKTNRIEESNDQSVDEPGIEDSIDLQEDSKSPPILQRQSSISSLKSASSTEGPDPASESSSASPVKEEDALRSSKSDSSLNGTFEVITESEVRESVQQRPVMTSSPNVLSPVSPNGAATFGAVKKSRHVLKDGDFYIN